MCSGVGVGIPDLVEAYAYCAGATCPFRTEQNAGTTWTPGAYTVYDE